MGFSIYGIVLGKHLALSSQFIFIYVSPFSTLRSLPSNFDKMQRLFTVFFVRFVVRDTAPAMLVNRHVTNVFLNYPSIASNNVRDERATTVTSQVGCAPK